MAADLLGHERAFWDDGNILFLGRDMSKCRVCAFVNTYETIHIKLVCFIRCKLNFSFKIVYLEWQLVLVFKNEHEFK